MIIPIDEHYRIKAGTNSWNIHHKGTNPKTGEPSKEWHSDWSYSTLDKCIKGCGDLMLRESNKEGLVDALKEAKRICTMLSDALTVHFNGRDSLK